MEPTNSKLTGEVYFSRRFPASAAYTTDLLKFLGEHEVDFGAYEIEENIARWAQTGLRSVPSVVFRLGGKPVSNIVKYASFEEVLARAQQCCSSAPQPTSAETARPAVAEDTSIAALGQLLPYVVVGSSGCHRYERWNEHAVADEDTATGWVCPGAEPGKHEFLHFDFQVTVSLNAIALKPRLRTDGTPSYKSFPKGLSIQTKSDSSKWRTIWERANISIEDVARDFVIRAPSCIACREVKIIVTQKHDIDGKTFPCITGVRFFGEPAHEKLPGFATYRLSRQQNANVFFKSGVFAQDRLRIELYNLVVGQKTPANFSSKHKVLVPLEGKVEVLVDGAATVSAGRGQVVVIRPSHPFQVRGLKRNNRVLVVYAWEGFQSVWESR